jgi:hypothetical protein
MYNKSRQSARLTESKYIKKVSHTAGTQGKKVSEKRTTTPVKGSSQRSASAASGNSRVVSKKEKESNAKKLASATDNWRRSERTKKLQI